MKYIVALLFAFSISLSAYSQLYTFNTHYLKIENGFQPQFVDSVIRTIEIKKDVVIVTNLFGCAYTNEFRIVERLSENTFVIAYEGNEVVVMYSPDDRILVVTNGVGVKGERTIHIYGEQVTTQALL